MRRKNFLCKMTAAFLSAAMVVTCTPENGQTRANAAEMEQAQEEFRFGSAGITFAPGTYNLKAALKNAGDITKDSMAASCLQGAVLTVNEDGSATVTLDLSAVTVMGTTAWASDWKVFLEQNITSDTVDAEVIKTDEDGNATQIKFTLPDIKEDGVYASMFVSAMNTTMQAYFAFDFAGSASSGETTVEEKKGSAKIEQFGGYDVNVVVSVQNGKIVDIEVEGANFEGSSADYNKTKLQTAADGLKTAYVDKSVTDASEIEGVDAVSGATVSSHAIRDAVLDALGLEASGEVINLPTEKLTEGTYQVDIAFYTDGVKHSLIENDTAKATITVDADGNMALTTAVISGSEKEPLYFYDFNGYYEGNDPDGTLKAIDSVKKEDVAYSDDVFGEDEKVVTEVTFPLEGEFAVIYCANASIYVPAMKSLTGDMGGITFDQGRFSADCFAKIYWDSLKKEVSAGSGTGFGVQGTELGKGTYILPVKMKNATDITKDSMAGSCLQGAVLTVNEDGSAKVTLDLTSVTVMGQTAWASDWKIYQGPDTDSDLVDAAVTRKDEDGNVTQIEFAVPDNHTDGVYISMTSGRTQNAYLAFDYANAKKQNLNLEDGLYAVEGTMLKPDLTTKSMADTAFHHNVQMTVENGKATLTLNLKGMEITGLFGYLGNMKYYETGYEKDANGNPKGTLKEVTVKSVQKYSDGVVISDDFGTNYPDMISFEVIPEALEDGIVPLQVSVPIMESITTGTGDQNVYLKLDMDNLVKTTEDDERFEDKDVAPVNPNTSSGSNSSGSNTGTSGNNGGTVSPSPSPAGNSSGTSTSISGNNGGTTSSSSSDDSKSTVKVGQTAKVKGHTYKVTAKGKVSFLKCKKNAKSVTIPVSIKIKGVTCKVTGIAKNAFKGNKKLTKVTISKNVSKVGKNAFSGCKKLKTVKLKGFTKKKKAAMKKLIKKAGITSKVKIK